MRKREKEENLKFVFLMPQTKVKHVPRPPTPPPSSSRPPLLHCSKLAVAATARNIPHTTPSVRAIYNSERIVERSVVV